MNHSGIDIDELFCEAFVSGGGGVVECACGKLHVAIDSDYFSGGFDLEDNDDDIESSKEMYLKMASAGDAIIHNSIDYIDYCTLQGQEYVLDCECKGYQPFMNFIFNERFNIAAYLTSVSEEFDRVAEYNKTLMVLQDFDKNRNTSY